MIPFIPITKNKDSASRVSQNELNKTLREGEIIYGEICYICDTNIGDAIGSPRVCSKCEPIIEKHTKSWWQKIPEKFWQKIF